ncbi:HEAT repeat domain-containing protein [Saliphagus infecundisoli]|uniref:HEAT repeat domain-containing protein n=1 Tax=Saliphagus infecundisoli TaxID=1849069 RepID=A0ABD5Q9L6_9EURY|nr:HEAT repeat domain-containing protein [Saliphagus infecundisoli]
MPLSPDEPEASVLCERAQREPESVAVAAVVDHLVFGDRATRRTALEAYETLVERRPGAVEDAATRLAEHLAADDWGARRRAALTVRALVEPAPEAVEGVVPELRALGDSRKPGREAAVDALAGLALERPEAAVPAVEVLAAICHEPVEPVEGGQRVGPARASGGGPLAPERERRDRVRVRAIAGLTRIAAVEPAAMEPVVAGVGDLLSDDHNLVRAAACEVFEAVATTFPDEVAAVADALAERAGSDPEQPVPWRAADALVALAAVRPARVGRAVAPVAADLSRFLDSREADRRRTGTTLAVAAAAVRPTAIEPAGALLEERLADEDDVRTHAATALALSGVGRARALRAVLAGGVDRSGGTDG